MTETLPTRSHGPNPWRMPGWTLALLLLLLPAVAMQFTDEVNWTASDFIFAAIVFGITGSLIEFMVRRSPNAAYRSGAVVAVLGLFLLVWLNAAVGLIGSENSDANAMYAGVIGVLIVGTILSRLRAAAMVQALVATAIAQAIVGFIAIVWQLGFKGPDIMFIGIWLASAALFHVSSRQQREAI
ncbi:hypothetical protein [Sphingomonas sp. LY160]|uniref:hypothetical protein n=1 Tax=Sphingomonas sp. LY160 TaxID=3095342 RepID=UPI002ADEC75D|nr:hypothetical protein [Sphingomonas sp. LY160]MEA1072607.1 hypothetical protein [Sphingomonas sp. LY160]